jgi:hypothetical protein
VGLERGSLSLVSTTEELLERKSSFSGLEDRDYGRRGSITLTMWHPLSAKVGTNFANMRLALGRYVNIVCSQTQAMEFSFFFSLSNWIICQVLIVCYSLTVGFKLCQARLIIVDRF